MNIFKNIPLYTNKELRYLCERLIPFTSLIDDHYGSCYCKFHLNTNTPAASLFLDKDGIERMYCYHCKRQYTSYDYIVKVLEERPIDHLLKIANKEELDEMLKYRIDAYELKTSKLVFTTIDNLLTEIYDYDLALSI